jgi:hypothetical protein
MIAGNNDNDVGDDYRNVITSTTFPCMDCCCKDKLRENLQN